MKTETSGSRSSAKKRKREESFQKNVKTIKGIFKKDDLDDSLSTSDWDLVIDETNKNRNRSHTFQKDNLYLVCAWKNCSSVFTNYDELMNDHLKAHLEDYTPLENDENPYKCYWSKCVSSPKDDSSSSTNTPGGSFKTLGELTRHLVFHGYHLKLTNIGQNAVDARDLPKCTQTETFRFPTGTEWYKCEWDACREKFWTIYDFLLHIKCHMYQNFADEDTRAFPCLWKGCKVQVKTQNRLTEHLNIHTKERMLACPTCGHLFANRTKLQDHRKRQLPTTMRSYFCSQCSKYFPSERLLKDHMRLHINQYKCSMCDMTCPKPSNLALHIRNRHLNVKPFKCPKCKYSCVEKHNLDRHIAKHDPENQYNCEDCDFQCRSAFTLDRHYRKKHDQGEQKIYECQVCKKRFKRGGVLTKHLMKAHKYHWPSGHVRFRYKPDDEDGVHRLQTVRYETLDVTEEIIKGHTMEPPSSDVEFDVIPENGDPDGDDQDDKASIRKYRIVFSDERVRQKGKRNKRKRQTRPSMTSSSETDESDRTNDDEEEQIVHNIEKSTSSTTVIITIDDVDSEGNVVNSKTMQGEIVCSDLREISVVEERANEEYVVEVEEELNEKEEGREKQKEEVTEEQQQQQNIKLDDLMLEEKSEQEERGEDCEM